MSSNNEESLSKFYELLYLPKDASLQQIEYTYQLFKEFKEGFKEQKLNSVNKKLLVEHELAFCEILKFKNAEREKPFQTENQKQQKSLLIPDGMMPIVMKFETSQFNSTNSSKLQSNVLQNRLSSVKPRNYFDIRPIPLQSPGTSKQIHIPQTNFKRINQFDIEYNENIVMKEGQTCCEMKIPIDREFLTFIHENQERGNLVVRFQIVTKQEFDEKQVAKTKIAEKAPVTKHNVLVTLEEVFEGSQKSVSINRKRFDDQTGEKWIEKASFTLDIKAGTPDGEEKLFPAEGDQLANGTFSDLLFCLQTAPHQVFTRDGADLKYLAKVSESQLKNQEEILIPTLDGRTFKVKLDDEVLLGGSKKYFGHGLPYPNDTQIRGNLLVEFEIVSEKLDQLKVDLPKLKPNQCKLKLTLEEIYSGCQKKRSFFRKITCENGKSVSKMIQLAVPVKPGSIEGTTIQMDNQGDSEGGKSQADVILTVEEIKHPIFTRVDHDLECDLQVTKNQLENGGHFDIPTLEGKSKKIYLEGPIKENFVKKITKFGLPFLDEPKKFGDILVKFVLKPEIKPKTKDPDIEQNLGITLEEIFTGCTKKLKINRQVLDAEGKEHFSDEIISIDVPPGCKEGHKFRFSNLGDEFPDRIPADIVFTIKYKAHSQFTPKGNDIECIEMITLEEVQLGIEIKIPSLKDPQPIFQLVNKLTNIEDGLKIPNKGLPIDGNLENQGNLLIYFKIVSNTLKVSSKETVCLITFEEMLQDTAKKLIIPQIVYDKRGTQIAKNKKELNFVVKNGTSTITKLTFTRFGDLREGFIQGDVTVILKPENHKVYTRLGSNLEYTVKVKSSELSKLVQLNVPLLDGTYETIKFEMVAKKLYKKIPKQGLPISALIPNSRGDLFVKLEIEPQERKETSLFSNLTSNKSLNSKNIFSAQNDRKSKLPKAEKSEKAEKENKEFGKMRNPELSFQHEPIFQNVEVSLEEVLIGSIKPVRIQRKAIDSNGNEFWEHKLIILDVKPGTMSGQKMTYLKLGHYNGRDKLPGDVIFTIKDKPNDVFIRNGADIEFITLITKSEAKYGFTRNIPSLELDGLQIPIQVNGKTLHNSINRIPGQGLPMATNSSFRGDLIVKFKIDKKEFVKLPQGPPQHFDVNVTLEKIAKGGIEKIKFQRKITFKNGIQKFENDKFTINIKPGTTAGTQFTLPKKGDVNLGMFPSDLIYTVQYAPHENFMQSGVNLEYNCLIYSKETRYGADIKIPTLYGPYFVKFTNEITNGSTLEIDNYGLPHKNDNRKRGKLIVHFKESMDIINRLRHLLN